MSERKLWYAVYDAKTSQWNAHGRPRDKPLPKRKGKLFFGSFRTRRAAQFTAELGYLVGTVKDTEALAKQSAVKPRTFLNYPARVSKRKSAAPSLDKPVRQPIDYALTSYYLKQLVEGMMG